MLSKRADLLAVSVILLATLIYGTLIVANHLALHSNAFDLSVFDYALWSTSQGHLGDVPFFGHSLQSHHFMPTLGVLLPIYLLFPDPSLLIAVQITAFSGAGWLLWRIMRARVPALTALALLLAFFFSRRSHSAATSVFYVESLEPLLAFAFVMAASSKRWALASGLGALLLGCKEDVALYLGTAGAVLLLDRETRRIGALIMVASGVWLALALFVAIPAARVADGLGAANPFWEARFGDAGGTDFGSVFERLASARTVSKLIGVLGMTGLVALLAPRWLAVIVPGVLLNLMARPDTLQSGLIGHYLWPIIPPLFLASLAGAAYLSRYPQVLRGWSLLLLVVIVADSPLWRQPPWSRVAEARALSEVRQELRTVGPEVAVLAQPQLIPHLPHRARLTAIGREIDAGHTPDVILLCDCGDPWPLTPDTFREQLAHWQTDPRYVEKRVGPLTIFTRRQAQVVQNQKPQPHAQAHWPAHARPARQRRDR
jgi:uncharacterized membrane protein